MARQKNDGRGRMGGRAKGTPNRVNKSLREWVLDLVNKNKRQIKKDLEALDPRDRLAMLERLMRYVLPRMESVTAAVDLNMLSDEQINQVIEQITANVTDDGDSIES